MASEVGYENLGRQPSADLRRQYSSHHYVPAEQHFNKEDIDAELRAGFLRKVYGILGAQMLMTTCIVLYCMSSESIRMAVISLNYQFGGFMLFIPTLAVLCCMQAAKNSYPMNYALLFVFTLLMSLDIGGICAMYAETGQTMIVVEAFAITCFIFFALSVYTIISKRDFGFMGAYLFAGLLACLAIGFLGIFFPSLRHNMVFAGFGALIFSGYIVYDTWKITKVFGYDDYIIAAIELYLDILNLFIYILQMLGDR